MAIVDIIIITTGVSIPVSRFVPERVPDQEFPPYRNVCYIIWCTPKHMLKNTVTYSLTPPPPHTHSTHTHTTYPIQNDDIQVMFYNYQCSSEKGLIWVTILFGYKILFIMSGTVLAFLTRKVKVRGLNESREVQLVMIMITPIAVGSLILRLALRDYLNVVGSVYALSASLSGGIMLCIIFIPKVHTDSHTHTHTYPPSLPPSLTHTHTHTLTLPPFLSLSLPLSLSQLFTDDILVHESIW